MQVDEVRKIKRQNHFEICNCMQFQNTTTPNIYALGDVAGKYLLTPGRNVTIYIFDLSIFVFQLLLLLDVVWLIDFLTISLIRNWTMKIYQQLCLVIQLLELLDLQKVGHHRQ